MLKTTLESKVCFGYTNIASKGFYLPFFDYDNIDINDILKELKRIQNKFMLSNIYIYESKNGFNALSLDKLPFNVLKELYKNCEYLCEDYVRLGLDRSFLTLRLGGDKKLFTVLVTRNRYYIKSLAHALVLIEFLNTNVEIDKDFDSNTVIRLKAYRSAKHGFIEVKAFE